MPSTRPRMIASSQDMRVIGSSCSGAQCTGASSRPARQTAPQTAESPSVLHRCEPDLATEQPREERRVFVADFVGDGFHRLLAHFQHVFGFLESQRVYVF